MRLTKRGDTWYCYVYENGRRIQRTTRCRDKKAAEAVARAWERRAADPDGAAKAEATLSEALERLILTRAEEARAGRKSDATVEFYQRKAAHLVRVFEPDAPFPLALLSAPHVDAYISKRRAEGAAENTISKELVTLRAALKLALRAKVWSGVIEAVVPIAFAPQYAPKKRALSVQEVQLVLAALTPDRAARMAFIVATSASWGETERARREDISADLSSVFIRGTKRATRRRMVPIVLPIARNLIRYAVEHAEGAEGLLFRPWGNVRRDLHEAAKRATRRLVEAEETAMTLAGLAPSQADLDRIAERVRIAPFSPNDLRRTCATWLRAAGAEPHLIAPVMGHSDSRMVEKVYGRLATDDLRDRLSASLSLGAADCITGASDSGDSEGLSGQIGRAGRGAENKEAPVSDDGGLGVFMLPRDGIEPPTRGFSIPAPLLPNPRKDKRTGVAVKAGASRVIRSKVGIR